MEVYGRNSVYDVYAVSDRRALLRMLDEARDALFLAGVRLTTATTAALGYEVICKRDEPPYSPTLEAIMELKADHEIALTKVGKELDEARADYHRLATRLNDEAKAEKEHCKDCCCARSWRALGISEYTGKSIPDHISELRAENERLREALYDQPIDYTGEDERT